MLRKPSKSDLHEAMDRSISDVIDHGLDILFCGINPGLYSGAVGRHFARPGNRFWKAIFLGGITDRILSCFEQDLLVKYGVGITNLVNRTTPGENALKRVEFKRGAILLESKVMKYRPRAVVFLGIGAYRRAFSRYDAKVGLQFDHVIGGARVWLLPNPSGLNASYQVEDLGRLMTDMRKKEKLLECGTGGIIEGNITNKEKS